MGSGASGPLRGAPNKADKSPARPENAANDDHSAHSQRKLIREPTIVTVSDATSSCRCSGHIESRNQYAGFENYPRRLIRSIARSLKNQFPGAAEDVEDFEQELALHLHVARRAYDPSRSAPDTFAKHVVTSKAASLVNARNTQ